MDNNSHPSRFVCVTPTRNESWIIGRFLAAAKCWATDVIVADQGSTDGTLETLRSTPGVTPVLNESPTFDEAYRQRLLLDNARRIPGKRILIGLDADEALSANFAESKAWQQIGNAKPGTILRFRWVNILPGFKQAWVPPKYSAFGFVDDGCDFRGWKIHSPRVPQPPGAPVLDLEDVVVLHFQYVAWDRMLSKQRWYQAWEHVQHRQKGPLQIFREYHHMHGSWDKSEIQPLNPMWLANYERAGIDFRSLKSEPVTWWDREIVQMLRQHGPREFRRVAVWEKDWNAVAHALGVNGVDLGDPRSATEKVAHRLLAATQPYRATLAVRAFERFLRSRGW